MFFHFISHYKYVVLFLGVFFGGDTALLAGLYLAIVGIMWLPYVVAVTLVASIFGDAIFYGIGMLLSYERLKKLPYFRSHMHHIDALERFLDKHAVKTLFYSKFVYGSRTIVQLLSGMHSIDLVEYFSVNVIATSLWIGTIVIFVRLVRIHARTHPFSYLAHDIEIGFAALIVFVIVIHVLVQRLFIDKIDEGTMK